MEAALRFDCQIARCPVHKLDISESGSGQLQTRFQNVTEYRPKVGTAGKSRCNVRWHVPAIIRVCAGPFYWVSLADENYRMKGQPTSASGTNLPIEACTLFGRFRPKSARTAHALSALPRSRRSRRACAEAPRLGSQEEAASAISLPVPDQLHP